MPKKNITRAILFAVILAAVVLVLWLNNARQARAAGTVLLSNGKSVYIGQSKAALEKNLGSSLRVKDDQYSYISDNGAVEAVIFMNEGKVGVIRVISDSRNRHQATNIGIATKSSDITVRGIKKVTSMNSDESLTGYRYDAANIVGYFLTNPCTNDSKVLAMVVARSGREGVALPTTTKIGCEGEV